MILSRFRRKRKESKPLEISAARFSHYEHTTSNLPPFREYFHYPLKRQPDDISASPQSQIPTELGKQKDVEHVKQRNLDGILDLAEEEPYGRSPSCAGTTLYSGTPSYGGATLYSGTPSYGGTTLYSGTPSYAGTTSYSGTPSYGGVTSHKGTPLFPEQHERLEEIRQKGAPEKHQQPDESDEHRSIAHQRGIEVQLHENEARMLENEAQVKEMERKSIECAERESKAHAERMQRLTEMRNTLKINEHPSKQSVKRVRNLIREKYRLDIWIWEHRFALEKDRDSVILECNKSDKILEEIRYIVNDWNRTKFHPKGLEVVKGIKKGILCLDQQVRWGDIPPWDLRRDESSVNAVIAVANELCDMEDPKLTDTMKEVSPILAQEARFSEPEASRSRMRPNSVGQSDILKHQFASGKVNWSEIPVDQSIPPRSERGLSLLARGRSTNINKDNTRARSESPQRSCSWLPQVSTCAPQANFSPSKVSKRSRSSAGRNGALRRLQLNTGYQGFNGRDGHSSETESEQEDDRPPPPLGPLTTPLLDNSKRFPCLNTVGEPEASRSCKHSFEHISQLARHMKTHNFFVCHKCIKTFAEEQELTAHEQLPHSRCRSRGCRRYRACECEADLQSFSNFHCGACISSSKSKFDALLLSKYPHHGQRPSNTTANLSAADESGSSEDLPMSGPHLDYIEPFSDLCINPMDTEMQHIEWQDFDFSAELDNPSATTASNQFEYPTLLSNDTTSDGSGHRYANEEHLQQLTKEVVDLKGKVDKLEERLNHPTAPTCNPALEHVLGMVWQELVLSGNPKVWANAPLYNLVQCIAPNVIASSQVYAQSPRHDSVLSYVAPAAASFANFTSGLEKGKQKEPSIGLFPGVGVGSS